jgi:peptidoglycan-N-acetylglucosamine deacetylase
MHESYAGWIGRRDARAAIVGDRRHGALTTAVGADDVPTASASSAPARRRRMAAVLLAVLALCLSAGPAAAGQPSGRPATALTGMPAPKPAEQLPAQVVLHGPRTQKVVALTFDDGYGPAVCGALVDVLVETQTPATFFPNSVNVVHAPALWQRVAELGFPIGNHTVSHPYMPGLTFQQQWIQIWNDRVALERVIGEPSLAVFRPPYGAYSPGTLIAAHAAGYDIVLNWDASFADSSRRPDGKQWPTASYARAASRGINGSVILGHCGSSIDLAALPAVIASYRERGFTFVTIPELLGLPGAKPMRFEPPTLRAGLPAGLRVAPFLP